MPQFTVDLSQGRPLIDLVVAVSAPRAQALTAAGQAVPAPQALRGLIDTGASCTCVDPMIFTALGLQPTGTVPMLTPSTGVIPQDADTYDVGILIPNGQELPLIFPVLAVSASELYLAQGFHALIGRDVLADCLLIYNGKLPYVTLAY